MRILIIISLIAISLTSCTKSFRDINTDLSGITEEQLRTDFNHLTTPFDVIQQGIYFNYDFGKGKNWPFQIMQNLNADMFSGYMMDYKPHNGGTHNSDYNLQDGWNGSNWLYTYSYTMPQLKKIIDSTENQYPLLHGVALVLKVETMHRLSDIYGPIIYSKFGEEDGDYSPDTQKEAYYSFFTDLDRALVNMSVKVEDRVQESILSKFDILLDGQSGSWIKFANSLRMRLAIRISGIDPVKAKSEFKKALEHPIGLFEKSGESAIVSTAKGYVNPLGEISQAWGEVQLNASMESIMVGYEDPRLPYYFETCKSDVMLKDINGNDSLLVELQGKYKGIRQGTNFKHLQYASHSMATVTQSTNAPLLTAAEVWFLRAEGAIRGFSTESAQECYENGITASFSQWSVKTSANNYISSETMATDYKDAFDKGNDMAARCQVSPKWIESATFEEKLEKIITQKWIAIFPEGCEAWTEQRRTGYPRLFPVRYNNSRGTIDTETMIRRLPFPADLADTDPQQYQALVTALGNPDNGGTRLWWDVIPQ